MNKTIRFDDQVTVGPQPTAADLEEIKSHGFKTVINFRHRGEDQQPLSPEEEGQRVEELGMAYLHVPVSMKSLTPSLVDQFRREFRNVAKPVFAHCKLGTRAGLMLIMNKAIHEGMSGTQANQQAREMGFKAGSPEAECFVRDYVDSRSHAPSRD